MPEPLEQAATELQYGNRQAMIAVLEDDPRDKLAMLLASFARDIEERENRTATAAEKPIQLH
jgi:hypothetical protein